MKIIYIATGAANMYCGSCMHDNALAAALKAAGEDVSLFPLYTPMRLDEESVGERQIFYGGIKAYLLQKYPRLSLGRSLLLRVAGSQAFLRLMPRFDIGSAVDPKANAEMTISILKGEQGNQRELLQELVGWIKSTYRPDLIHITNTLLIGVAREFKRSLQVPITCGLHGEDIFLEGMPQPYQDEALGLICERAHDVDRFLSISTYYAEACTRSGLAWTVRKSMSSGRGSHWTIIASLLLIQSTPRPLTIGFLARFVPEKGLHLLLDAFISLVRSGEFPDLRLLAGGYLSQRLRDLRQWHSQDDQKQWSRRSGQIAGHLGTCRKTGLLPPDRCLLRPGYLSRAQGNIHSRSARQRCACRAAGTRSLSGMGQ